MNVLNPIFAASCLFIALLTASLFSIKYGTPLIHDKFSSLDGLRGYLAFFVFLHHSAIWFYYLRSHVWKIPPSNLYTHFGQSSVAMFFMITGFLFFSKLLDEKNKIIDWNKLYLSRFFRLTPLYVFSILILILISVVLSGPVLNVTYLNLLSELVHWTFFTIMGAPDLNGVKHTSLIMAGVTWSLAYEWLFYLSLPALALTVGIKPPKIYIFLSCLALSALLLHFDIIKTFCFIGGILSAILVRFDKFRKFSREPIASLICILAIIFTVNMYTTTYEFIPIILLSLAFSIIACGNTIFGLLTTDSARFLGEISYGIYLLQGFVLYITFHFLIGESYSAILFPIWYYVVIMICTPILIILSFTTFTFIEKPFIRNKLVQKHKSSMN